MPDLCSHRNLNRVYLGDALQFGKVPRYPKHIHTSIKKNLYFSVSQFFLLIWIKVDLLVSQLSDEAQ